ncbi:MAG: nuclear transport factor 2 family protein, partial [Thermoplasmata archaeon]
SGMTPERNSRVVADDASADAVSVLAALQELVDGRDAESLIALFDESAVLVGTGGDARNRDGLRRYLTAVATQPESLRWEWKEVVPYYRVASALGFAAFGEVVVSGRDGERRAPIRVTIFALQTHDGWQIRQFHGSIPSDF